MIINDSKVYLIQRVRWLTCRSRLDDGEGNKRILEIAVVEGDDEKLVKKS